MQPYVVFLLLAGLLGAQASINSNAYGGSYYNLFLHLLELNASACFWHMPAASPPKPSWAGSERLDQAMQTCKAKPLFIQQCCMHADPQTLPENFNLEDHMLQYPPRPLPQKSCACRVDITKNVVMTSQCPTPWDHPAKFSKVRVCMGLLLLLTWITASCPTDATSPTLLLVGPGLISHMSYNA